MTLTNSTATKSGKNVINFITNKGTMNLRAFDGLLTNTYLYENYSVYYARTLYNTGNVNAEGNTRIRHVLTSPNDPVTEYAISAYNDGGAIEIAESSFIADGSNVRNDSTATMYGIYNPTGSLTIKSGLIQAVGSRYSYGIWNNTGTVAIGIPEPTTSPNYGRDTADVSIDNPDIHAISTDTGTGIYNNTGKVYYYDGVVTGKTSAFSSEPTVTEHFYEVCTELDTSTTPNLYTAKLFWMRDGQSSCAQN